jgi:hypothetical protein
MPLNILHVPSAFEIYNKNEQKFRDRREVKERFALTTSEFITIVGEDWKNFSKQIWVRRIKNYLNE